MVKSHAIVTARTTSSRLPGKSLLDIHGMKTIELVLHRAGMTGFPVLLATSADPSDDRLAAIARERGVTVFRGALLNKLRRWRDCFQEHGVTHGLLVDGDDLLWDPLIGRRAAELLAMSRVDLVRSPDTVVCGLFTQAMARTALDKLEPYTRDPGLDTDVITEFVKNAGLASVEVPLEPWERERPYRLTLDYAEDYRLFAALVDALGPSATSREVIAHLDAHPELAAINQHRQQDYLENQQRFNVGVRAVQEQETPPCT